jgi:hypothetical protein
VLSAGRRPWSAGVASAVYLGTAITFVRYMN